MDWTLEVVILPVSDIDRSVAFYRNQIGFDLDHDTSNEHVHVHVHVHVVQLTPRGSGCSIEFGDLPPQREIASGSLKGLQMCVADAAAAERNSSPEGSRPVIYSRSANRTAAPSLASPTQMATPGRSRS